MSAPTSIFLLLLLSLSPSPSLSSHRAVCQMRGRCSRGSVLERASVSSAPAVGYLDCLERCRGTPNCQWFTVKVR